VPDFNVTTDLIVGFPGETDDEWKTTLQYLATERFGHMHIFTYSEREGTKAATLPNPVPKAKRQQRSRDLQVIAAAQRSTTLQRALGSTVPVLWEGGVACEQGFRHAGYTPNYLKVETVSACEISNQILSTRITHIENDRLVGVCC